MEAGRTQQSRLAGVVGCEPGCGCRFLHNASWKAAVCSGLDGEHFAELRDRLWSVMVMMMRGPRFWVEREQDAGQSSVWNLAVAVELCRLKGPGEQVVKGYICCCWMCWVALEDHHIHRAPAEQLALWSWVRRHCRLPVLCGLVLPHAVSVLHEYDELLLPFSASGPDGASPWTCPGCTAGRMAGQQDPRPYAVRTAVQESRCRGICRHVRA